MRHKAKDLLRASLSVHLPFVWRTCVAMSRTAREAEVAVRQIVEQAKEASTLWSDADAATRWFRHHTILLLRDVAAPTGARDDPLLHSASSVQQKATLAAFRKLPRQQQEALLLGDAAGLTNRQVGVAMDCSVTAAEGHRRAAREALVQLQEDAIGQLARAYEAIDVPSRFSVDLKNDKAPRTPLLKTVSRWLLFVVMLGSVVLAAYILATRVEI